VKRTILLSVGFCSLGLGVIGVFIPLLPTTPFLLLSASCFLKSSARLYRRLIGHKVLGKYIENYLNHRAVSLRSKLVSVSLLWVTIGSTIVFFVDTWSVRCILGLVAIGVTIHLLRLRTLTAAMLASDESP